MTQLASPAERSRDDADQDGGGSEQQDHGHTQHRAMLVAMPPPSLPPDAAGPPGLPSPAGRAPAGGPALAAGTPSPGRTALLAVVGSIDGAYAAIEAGAGLIELTGFGAGEPRAIGQLRRRHPGVPVCGSSAAAHLVRQPALARASGARLICADMAAAAGAGRPAGGLLVQVLPQDIGAAVARGWLALVDADQAAALAGRGEPRGHDTPAGLAGVVALAALSSWLGAAVVRTRHPVQVGRALALSAAIAGLRAPARTVRGLA